MAKNPTPRTEANEAIAQASQAAENVSRETEAAPAAKAEDSKESKRIVIRFITADKKGQLAAPSQDCIGLAAVHNPSDDLPARQFVLGAADLLKHPALVMQLALFGASVHLRNQINTEKDESEARAAFEARLAGFKSGIYRQASEGGESTPLVIQAYRQALVTSGQFAAEAIESKVTEKMQAWSAADRKGKLDIRSRLMGNQQVQDAYKELSVKNAKPAEKPAELGDL